MQAERTSLDRTPLLVNFLRLLRNGRVPPVEGGQYGERAQASFDFGGLHMTDMGAFKEAERVWATHNALSGGGDLQRDDGLGSTYAGPLHLLVVLDGVTVEHWTLEDYRETHTENAVPRNYDQLEKLNGIVRILFTYLRASDVYRGILSAAAASARRSIATDGEPDDLRGSTSSNPHTSSPISSSLSPVASASSIELWSNIALPGVVLSVHGDEAAPGRLCNKGLLHLLDGDGFDTAHATARYRSRQWYTEELLKVSVVTDTQWRSPLAAAAMETVQGTMAPEKTPVETHPPTQVTSEQQQQQAAKPVVVETEPIRVARVSYPASPSLGAAAVVIGSLNSQGPSASVGGHRSVHSRPSPLLALARQSPEMGSARQSFMGAAASQHLAAMSPLERLPTCAISSESPLVNLLARDLDDGDVGDRFGSGAGYDGDGDDHDLSTSAHVLRQGLVFDEAAGNRLAVEGEESASRAKDLFSFCEALVSSTPPTAELGDLLLVFRL